MQASATIRGIPATYLSMIVDLPLWQPGPERIERANLSRFLRLAQERHADESIDDYPALYAFSTRHPEKFWPCVWEFCGVRASGEFEPALMDGDKMPGAHWFPNVRLNFAQNLLRFKDDKPALIFRNECNQARELSYAQLHSRVGRVAQALRRAGVTKGDRVAGFLPNLPETIIAMLATASLGGVWSSASPDFGVNGIVDRFGQIEPKVLFCADAYPYGGKRHDCLTKVREVLAAIPSIEKCVVISCSGDALQLDGLRDAMSWDDFAGDEDHPLEFVPAPFDHPLYIMYSSGTTGQPKCIVQAPAARCCST